MGSEWRRSSRCRWRNPGEEERAARAESLRARLARLGDVNPGRCRRARASSRGRHEFLVAQRADLERSLEDLRRTIAKLTRTSRQRFEETFAAANEKLAEVFPKLFPGGKARLELVTLEEGGEPGIEIVVQPAGQEAAVAESSLRRREGADGGCADPVALPDPADAVLSPGRGRRAARRGQHRPLQPAGARDGDRFAVRAHHAQPPDDGGRRTRCTASPWSRPVSRRWCRCGCARRHSPGSPRAWSAWEPFVAAAVALAVAFALVAIARRRGAARAGGGDAVGAPPGPGDRLRRGLLATRRKLGDQLDGVLRRGPTPTASLLGEVEEALIGADVGVQTAGELVSRVRQRLGSASGGEDVRSALRRGSRGGARRAPTNGAERATLGRPRDRGERRRQDDDHRQAGGPARGARAARAARRRRHVPCGGGGPACGMGGAHGRGAGTTGGGRGCRRRSSSTG